MSDVFVSYASEDRPRVLPLVKALEEHGFSVWWDREIGLGAQFDLEIEKALDDAKCAIVVWSVASVASDWVRNEANEAHGRGILVPVRIDETKPPLAYRRAQTADLSNWNGNPTGDAIRPLFAIVGSLVGRSANMATQAEKRGSETQSNQAIHPTILVVPFSNLSKDEENEFLADGMTDEIITLLAADPNFSIVDRNSAFSFKGEYRDARSIASELNVRYIVEGSVRAAGGHVRVTVQLVDAESGSQIWAKRFDRPFTEIFAVQDDVVEGIVKTLGGEVYRAEGERSRQRPPESLNDWGLVVRATTELGKLGTSGFEEVISLCRRALEMNPSTSLASAVLANALAMRSNFSPEESDRSEALLLAESAMAEANDDPLVLCYVANALTWLGNGERAVGIVKRAIDLAPNIVTSYGTLAWALSTVGKLDESIEYARQAIAMSPRDLSLGRWYTTMARSYERLQKWQSALEAATSATDRMPDFAAAWTTKARALSKLGRTEEAVAASRTATELAPKYWVAWVRLAEALYDIGEIESAVDAAQRGVDLEPAQWRTLVLLAELLGATGRSEEAVQVWAQASALKASLSVDYLEARGWSTAGLRAAKVQ